MQHKKKPYMKRFRLILPTIGALICFWSTLLHAATYSPATVPDPKKFGQDYYVSNPDTILSQDDVNYLNCCCRMLEDTADVEMAVVVLGSIGNYEPFDFGYELFQRWGIGKAGKNTGVLITFALASRQVYINTGSGIEGILTDARCKMIIENDMIPRFKQGDYGGGLCAAATHIYTICSNGEAPEELMNMTSATNRGKFASSTSSSGSNEDDPTPIEWGIFTLLIFMFVWPFLMLVLIQRKTQSNEDEMEQRNGCLMKMICVCIVFPFLIPSAIWFWHRSKRLRCPKCGRQKYKIVKKESTTLPNGNTLKTDIWYCSACGYKHEEKKTIEKIKYYAGYSGGGYSSGSDDSDSSWSSSWDSDSSSSGSWGGGSSSGGGAGGSW